MKLNSYFKIAYISIRIPSWANLLTCVITHLM